MKKKARKKAKHRRTTRHALRTIPAKRSLGEDHSEAKHSSTPWLRMIPYGMEDEPRTDDYREFFSQRNGRRQPRDVDVYIPEDKKRTR
jgi:hypothetical protein